MSLLPNLFAFTFITPLTIFAASRESMNEQTQMRAIQFIAENAFVNNDMYPSAEVAFIVDKKL